MFPVSIYFASILIVKGAGDSSVISFLQLADWGGKGADPYQTPSQIDAVTGMSLVAEQLKPSFVIALGILS